MPQQSTPSNAYLLSEQEILRRLRALRYDRPPRLTDVAKAANLHRRQLYHLIDKQYGLQPGWQVKLSIALQLLEPRRPI
jgi:AraC-like DNA-binding protein